jgi:ankyrin repeat protein
MPLSSRLLEVAVWNDHGETVAQLLTNQCADEPMPRWHGRTLLQYAAWRGSRRAAAALLKAKAEVDRISRDGWGPALLQAASNCDLDMMRVLLEGKADVQLAGDGRVTPLMAAAEKKDTALVQLLYATTGVLQHWGTPPMDYQGPHVLGSTTQVYTRSGTRVL